MNALINQLQASLVAADNELKYAADILSTPHERLDMTFSDCEIARTYLIQAERALWGLQSWLKESTVKPV